MSHAGPRKCWELPGILVLRLESFVIQVIGGVNLRIPSPAKRRRVPSQEALDYLADKMNVANLPDPTTQFGLDMESRTCSERSETSSRLSFTLLARNIPMDDHIVLRNQKKANEVYGQRYAYLSELE